MQLLGKTAVVTGAGRGIGKAIALKLLSMGANVVANGTSEEVCNTVNEFKEMGYSNVLAVRGDIKESEDVDKLMEISKETFGAVDILVNNAGITRDGFMIRMSEKDWDDVIDTNLKGAFLCTKAAAKLMIKQKSGKIINIASVVGVTGNASQVNYSSAKAGLIGFTKSTAKELAARGITCNAVAPGAIESKMTEILPDKVKESYIQSIPLGRFGTPAEVAEVVGFLASESSNYVTGQVINIDGGMVM